jgi:hypothetical protein
MISAVKHRTVRTLRERATRRGAVPRRAGQHYFIEAEGLHSRLHFHNFYSTFWPQVDASATAEVRVYGADGGYAGSVERELPRFGSLFIEVRDVLAELGRDDAEGTVALDVRPPAGLEAHLGDLPAPEQVEFGSPFWMAYYDGEQNYMYVHAIDRLRGKVFGADPVLRRVMGGSPPPGHDWRSWRLLDSEGITELQVVTVNHGTAPGATTVGVYAAGGAPLWQRRLEFGPRQLHRVAVPREELATWPARAEHVRIGVDPLLTANGKPYVLIRYEDGPLSLHHG